MRQYDGPGEIAFSAYFPSDPPWILSFFFYNTPVNQKAKLLRDCIITPHIFIPYTSEANE